MEYQYVVRLCKSTEIREYPTRPYPVKTNNNSTRGKADFVQGKCSSETKRVGFKVYPPQENLTALIVVTASIVSLPIPSLPTFIALVVAATEPVTVVVEPVATFLLSPFFSSLITWSSLQLCVSLLPEPLSPERVTVFLLYLSVRR
ncbi:uncharacterized protein DS421_8g241690 [Arachis hypogaea]|nr:uncharacterized protein DS421_8g241690 [Arachis hypogaea]